MEEVLIKMASEQGLSFVVLIAVCLLMYRAVLRFQKDKDQLKDEILKALEDLKTNFKGFSETQELVKKLNTQEFTTKMDAMQKSIDRIESAINSKQ